MYGKISGQMVGANSVRPPCLCTHFQYPHIFMHQKRRTPKWDNAVYILTYCSGVGSGSGAGGSVSVTGSVTVSVTVSVFVDTSVVSLGCVKDGVFSVAFFVSVETEVVVVVIEVVVVVV